MNSNNPFKSGFITVVGRPNVGKSTLINALVGEKIAAVSEKPNTTRNRILGIRTLPDAQLIFLDTPGIHKARGRLGKAMVNTAMSAVQEADVILMMVEVKDTFGKGDAFIIESLPKPAILVINKIDTIKKGNILEIIERSKDFSEKIKEVIPISALNSDGISQLLTIISNYLPEGPRLFPEDMITDQPERFIVAEFIREKIFTLTQKEIPYQTAVVIEEFEELPEKNLINILAVIYVERKNHKGIIIGKKGGMLKEVGTLARADIEKILGTKVYLELWVKVKEGWSQRDHLIREFGYGN
ncbi:MAG: GTPase Era [Candidatus Dadabacteria bacterium]|nr:GTPase Era [Candidatus Dadabacteria bacterium]TDI88467.1 MAG: GTPase Era [Candidatus Dadabacteria bacterium]TDJ02657.1 MAG: GTPase Era [Candidatus Dadabacteria bacterium]